MLWAVFLGPRTVVVVAVAGVWAGVSLALGVVEDARRMWCVVVVGDLAGGSSEGELLVDLRFVAPRDGYRLAVAAASVEGAGAGVGTVASMT